MKTAISLLLTLIMTISSFVGCDTQSDKTLAENPASDFQYEVSESGKFIYINKYVGTSENVVIPAKIDGIPVTAIKGAKDESSPDAVNEGAFENCNIKSIVIPDSVKSIGYCAFKGCKELEDVTIPENSNLTIIGGCAFEDCEKLRELDISTTQIEQIDGLAFTKCSTLEEIKLPETLNEIGEKAFYECSVLSEITLPKNLTEIGAGAFGLCTSLKTVNIPATLNLMAVDEARFYDNPSLEKIIFDKGREEIDGYAFFGITSDVEIVIPEGVTKFSPLPFTVKSASPAWQIELRFIGDCPEFTEESNYFGEPTIYYDPATDGWDEYAGESEYNLKPIN